MAFPKLSHPVLLLAIIALFSALAMSEAKLIPETLTPAGAPASSTSDGISIDQGIAYVLMFLALVLTYIIHGADILDF